MFKMLHKHVNPPSSSRHIICFDEYIKNGLHFRLQLCNSHSMRQFQLITSKIHFTFRINGNCICYSHEAKWACQMIQWVNFARENSLTYIVHGIAVSYTLVQLFSENCSFFYLCVFLPRLSRVFSLNFQQFTVSRLLLHCYIRVPWQIGTWRSKGITPKTPFGTLT